MTNPLLEKLKLPGRIFQLPSRGYLYSNGELSSTSQNAEVHVHPMSALDEISMKNPDLLFSGKASDEVFKTCIPDIEKPLDLFGRDVDAVTLFLRIVSYGPNFSVDLKHTCKDAKEHQYNINLEDILNGMKYIDPTLMDELYTITLDNGQVVKTQPLRYKHVIELLQKNQHKKELTADDMKNNLVTNLLNLIVSIDGITDKKLIEEWIRAAQTAYIGKLATKIEQSSDAWGCDMVKELVCKDCGEKMYFEVPINPISFFTE